MIAKKLTGLLFSVPLLMASNVLGVNKGVLLRIKSPEQISPSKSILTTAAQQLSVEPPSSNTPPPKIPIIISPNKIKTTALPYEEEEPDNVSQQSPAEDDELLYDEQDSSYVDSEDSNDDDYNENSRKQSSTYRHKTKFTTRTTEPKEKNKARVQEKKQRKKQRPFSEAEKTLMRSLRKEGASWTEIANAMENRCDGAVRAFLENDGHILQKKPISPEEFQQILTRVIAGDNFVDIGRRFNRNIPALRRKIKKLGPEKHARIYALREQSLKEILDQATTF